MSTEVAKFKVTRWQKLGYWIWRGLPPGTNLEDVQQEAVIGAWRAQEGCEAVAARRAVIDYLRAWHRGSRQGRRVRTTQFVNQVSTVPNQEQAVLSEQERQRVIRAVDCLTVKQLAAINAVFYRELKQRDAAAEMGINEFQFSALKSRALKRLARELSFHGV